MKPNPSEFVIVPGLARAYEPPWRGNSTTRNCLCWNGAKFSTWYCSDALAPRRMRSTLNVCVGW
jgi:hypothetical protein